MELLEIEKLLKSEDKKDLEEARLKTREMLNNITSNIIEEFNKRQKLMDLIASSKRKSDSILQLDREYELISKFSELTKEQKGDYKMVEMLIWLITAAGKEKQRQILGRNNVFTKENLTQEELIKNLLELTKEIAPFYNKYGEGFSATKIAKDFEIKDIQNLIDTIENKNLAIDLGCANGNTTRLLAKKGFNKAIGFDISSYMLEYSRKLKVGDNEEYRQVDLFKGIPMGNESCDLVVSNFGTASQIDLQIDEVDRVLKKGGKAYLSFYNKDFLNSNWWQPWQGSLEPIKNPEDNILEVPLLKNKKIKTYKIFAKSYSLNELKERVKNTNLEIKEVKSHSLITTIMPPIFFEDEKRVQKVKQYEERHSKQAPYMGFYLNIVLIKK